MEQRIAIILACLFLVPLVISTVDGDRGAQNIQEAPSVASGPGYLSELIIHNNFQTQTDYILVARNPGGGGLGVFEGGRAAILGEIDASETQVFPLLDTADVGLHAGSISMEPAGMAAWLRTTRFDPSTGDVISRETTPLATPLDFEQSLQMVEVPEPGQGESYLVLKNSLPFSRTIDVSVFDFDTGQFVSETGIFVEREGAPFARVSDLLGLDPGRYVLQFPNSINTTPMYLNETDTSLGAYFSETAQFTLLRADRGISEDAATPLFIDEDQGVAADYFISPATDVAVSGTYTLTTSSGSEFDGPLDAPSNGGQLVQPDVAFGIGGQTTGGIFWEGDSSANDLNVLGRLQSEDAQTFFQSTRGTMIRATIPLDGDSLAGYEASRLIAQNRTGRTAWFNIGLMRADGSFADVYRAPIRDGASAIDPAVIIGDTEGVVMLRIECVPLASDINVDLVLHGTGTGFTDAVLDKPATLYQGNPQILTYIDGFYHYWGVRQFNNSRTNVLDLLAFSLDDL